MRFLRWTACAVAFVSAALLLMRGLMGPFSWMYNPLNAECALAVSVLAILLMAAPGYRTPQSPGRVQWMPLWTVLLAVIVGFLPILSMPLITDDYTHLQQIGSGEAPKPLQCLTHACGGPLVFRPLAFATYWAEWKLWDTSPLPRHAFDLVLHALASVLFLLIVRRMGVAPPFDWLAAMMFAWNGLHPEVVAWPGARFDAFAVLFSLAAALAVLQGGRLGLFGSVVATAAACLSKESAYVLPGLLALLLGAKAFTRPGRILIGSNFAVAAGLFVWRWIVLKGLGGYTAADGTTPTVLQFHPVSLLKIFAARIWGVSAFPINWSRPLEWWMIAGLIAGLAALLLLLGARPDRKRILLCLAGVVIACVPAHHLLLIDSSLERSRYLTLAVPIFTLLFVFACMGLPRRAGIGAAGLMVGFQLTALEHNLRIWHSVSTARYELCRSLAAGAGNTSGPIAINGVPLIVDGVYWRNGIEACLWVEFGIPMGKVRVNGEASSSAASPGDQAR